MADRDLGYIPALDGLRAVGIALVLVTHGAKPASWPGGYGVDVFFVLSGFLITTLLWREWQRAQRIRFARFYLRRAIRLYPALLTMLVASFLVGVLLTGDVLRIFIETMAAALYATPVTDFFVGDSLFYGHLWTLAVEEWFYLLWPPMLVTCLKLRWRWQVIAGLLIATAAALYAARAVVMFARGSDLLLMRVAAIALGCALALFIENTRGRGNGNALSILGVLGLASAWLLSGTGQWHTFTPLLAALATCALILSIVGPSRTIAQRILELAPVVYLGKVSYELYLWHVPFLLGAALIIEQPRNQVWWWAYPLAIAISAATHAAFLPLQRRLRRTIARSDIEV